MLLLFSRIFAVLSCILLLMCMLPSLKKSTWLRKGSPVRKLSRRHALWGVLLLPVSFIHGILAGSRPGMLSGKTAWLLLFVLLLFCLFRKKMEKPLIWKSIHKTFSVIFCILVLLHIGFALL